MTPKQAWARLCALMLPPDPRRDRYNDVPCVIHPSDDLDAAVAKLEASWKVPELNPGIEEPKPTPLRKGDIVTCELVVLADETDDLLRVALHEGAMRWDAMSAPARLFMLVRPGDLQPGDPITYLSRPGKVVAVCDDKAWVEMGFAGGPVTVNLAELERR